MMVSFWGAEVTEKKAVTLTPPEGYVLNLQMAALNSEKGKRYMLSVATEDMNDEKCTNVLCTLRASAVEQVKLDLIFGWTSPITFSVQGGPGSVHLSGYFQPGPGVEDMSEDEEDDYTTAEIRNLKRNMQLCCDEDSCSEGDEESNEEDSGRFEEVEDPIDTKPEVATVQEKKAPDNKKAKQVKNQNSNTKLAITKPEAKENNKNTKPQDKKRVGTQKENEVNAKKVKAANVTWDQNVSEGSDNVNNSMVKENNNVNVIKTPVTPTTPGSTPGKKKNKKRNRKGKGNKASPAP